MKTGYETRKYAAGRHPAQVLPSSSSNHTKAPSHRRNLYEGKASPRKMTKTILPSPSEVLVGICMVLTIAGIIPALWMWLMDELCSAVGDWVIFALLGAELVWIYREAVNG